MIYTEGTPTIAHYPPRAHEAPEAALDRLLAQERPVLADPPELGWIAAERVAEAGKVADLRGDSRGPRREERPGAFALRAAADWRKRNAVFECLECGCPVPSIGLCVPCDDATIAR